MFVGRDRDKRLNVETGRMVSERSWGWVRTARSDGPLPFLI